MKITKDTVVTFDYKLTNDEGEQLDSSEEDGPLVYLHGHEQILPGLENALDGHAMGESFTAVIPPEEGYGLPSDEEPAKIPIEQLPQDAVLEVGEELELMTPENEALSLWITEVDEDSVYLSPDHPLAGETLHFAITVKEVRAATAEELEHGHVHGEDDEHHH